MVSWLDNQFIPVLKSAMQSPQVVWLCATLCDSGVWAELSEQSHNQPPTQPSELVPMSEKVQLFSKMSPAFIECTLIIALMAFKLHPHSHLPILKIFITRSKHL